MINVPISAIVDFSASAPTASQNHASQSLRRLQSDAITTTYTVTLQSVYTAEQLSTQLSNAVTAGMFDATLHTFATANQATALTAATSGEVSVTYPTSNGGSNNSDQLSDGVIAGIVIGSVAGVVVIFLLVYFFACQSKKSPMGKQDGVEL